MNLAKKLIVAPGEDVKLKKHAADEIFDYANDDKMQLRTDRLRQRLDDLQYLFYAEKKHALLIILQALDAGGKDGTIRHVMAGVNPQGCRVTAFKVPSEEEASHDFLWRAHLAVPERGMFGIFNRSHYEDVLVVRVHNLVPKRIWKKRYDEINMFEKLLSENQVITLKFFLHISKKEQKKRFEERVADPNKNWKLSPADFAERRYWDEYTDAYEAALSRAAAPATRPGTSFLPITNGSAITQSARSSWNIWRLWICTSQSRRSTFPTNPPKRLSMEYRTLGKAGPKVSLVGLGCNNFGMRIDLEGTRRVVHKALDSGITLFDTADIYGGRGGSETMLGQVLGARRKDIVLATKFGGAMDDAGIMGGASGQYILSEAEASLARLKTEWIDLYQIHFPDPKTPMEQTLRALETLIQQGKVRYIGCSNHPAWKVVDAMWISKHFGLHGFVSAQDEYSLLVRGAEKELLPALDVFGLGLLPYFPLASGLLTGKYRKGAKPGADTRFGSIKRLADRYSTSANWEIVKGLEKFGKRRGRTLVELAFSWLASRPAAVSSIIAGATKPEQVEQNARAAGLGALLRRDRRGRSAERHQRVTVPPPGAERR